MHATRVDGGDDVMVPPTDILTIIGYAFKVVAF